MKIIIVSILTVAMIGLMIPSVFGQSTQTVEIKNGSSTPGCEPSCLSASFLSVPVSSTIMFMNYDSVSYYFNSGTLENGPDGKWSFEIAPASAHNLTLDEEGTYPYFSPEHPWITGTIIVYDDGSSQSGEISELPPLPYEIFKLFLPEYYSAELSGDVDFIKVAVNPSPVIGSDIYFAIWLKENDGSPINISILKDNFAIIATKEIDPATLYSYDSISTDNILHTNIRLESNSLEINYRDSLQLAVTQNQYTVKVPIYPSLASAMGKLDKKTYLPNDQVMLVAVLPSSNTNPMLIETISTELGARGYMGPTNIRDLQLRETSSDSGIFTTKVQLTFDSENTDCSNRTTKSVLCLTPYAPSNPDWNSNILTTIAFQLPCITDHESSSCVAGAGASILYAPEEQPQIEHTHLDGLTHTHGSGDIPHGHDSLAVIPDSGVDTSIPPYERAPITNARVVNAFGNSLSDVSVNQQVQIGADLVNAQDIDLPFAYLVQIKDNNGVIVSLSWITGEMSAGQTLSPALSWIPDASGTYEATIFLWESVINPTVLSDTISVNITVV